MVPTVAPIEPDRLPVAFALRGLDVAPEILRFNEPAHDGIGELAETIFAAGVLQPLTVRQGRGTEHPAMVLDGRRRLLALACLLEAGRLADDYPVSCFVETDVARQAAATVLTNTAVPVHVADVIVAIGKMLKAKLAVPAIAGALGYGELEARRLAAFSELHPKALEALKAGRCSLRQAKLLARLPGRAAQGEIAEAALGGYLRRPWWPSLPSPRHLFERPQPRSHSQHQSERPCRSFPALDSGRERADPGSGLPMIPQVLRP